MLLPFFQPPEEALPAGSNDLREYLTHKETLMRCISELEQDRLEGKIIPESYELARAELTAQAAACITRIRQLRDEDTDVAPQG